MPLFIGAAVPPFYRWVRDMKPHYVIQIFQQRGEDAWAMVKRMQKGLGEESFVVGEREFTIPDKAETNVYEGTNPVLMYRLDKTLPRKAKIGPTDLSITDPSNLPTKAKTPVDPGSQATNMLFRRKGIREEIAGTRGGLNLKDALPLVIMVAITCLVLGFVIFNYWHPGLYPAPPPGYTYKVVPFPVNSTTVTTVT